MQDGLKQLKDYIKSIRHTLHYLWTHPRVMKDWEKYYKFKGVGPKRFSRDVSTCWNLTYELLINNNDYKELLYDFIANNISDINLYSHQWDACKSILDTLAVFNNATYILSGVYYPTHIKSENYYPTQYKWFEFIFLYSSNEK